MQRENSHNSSQHLSKYADYRRRRDSAVDGSIALVKMILDDRASKGQSLDYGGRIDGIEAYTTRMSKVFSRLPPIIFFPKTVASKS